MIGYNWRVVHPSSIKETGIMWLFRGIKLSALLFLNQTQSYPPGYPSPHNNMFVLRGAFPAKNLFWYSNPYPSLVGSWRGCWFRFFGWGGDFFSDQSGLIKIFQAETVHGIIPGSWFERVHLGEDILGKTSFLLRPLLSLVLWTHTYPQRGRVGMD